LGYLCNFQETAQSKQSPIGRKFTQSGHPGGDPYHFEHPVKMKTKDSALRLPSTYGHPLQQKGVACVTL
jgi:hypothetical protein